MFSNKKTLTFVCTANVCRSPMAEYLMRHALAAEEEPYRSIPVISAGVSALGGEPASQNSIQSLEAVGLDLSRHESRLLTQSMLDNSFAVFCMTESHRVLIEMSFDRLPKHLYLMREFIPVAAMNSAQEIGDPFGQDLLTYKACRDNMAEAIPSILEFVKKNYTP